MVLKKLVLFLLFIFELGSVQAQSLCKSNFSEKYLNKELTIDHYNRLILEATQSNIIPKAAQTIHLVKRKNKLESKIPILLPTRLLVPEKKFESQKDLFEFLLRYSIEIRNTSVNFKYTSPKRYYNKLFEVLDALSKNFLASKKNHAISRIILLIKELIHQIKLGPLTTSERSNIELLNSEIKILYKNLKSIEPSIHEFTSKEQWYSFQNIQFLAIAASKFYIPIFYMKAGYTKVLDLSPSSFRIHISALANHLIMIAFLNVSYQLIRNGIEAPTVLKNAKAEVVKTLDMLNQDNVKQVYTEMTNGEISFSLNEINQMAASKKARLEIEIITIKSSLKKDPQNKELIEQLKTKETLLHFYSP